MITFGNIRCESVKKDCLNHNISIQSTMLHVFQARSICFVLVNDLSIGDPNEANKMKEIWIFQ